MALTEIALKHKITGLKALQQTATTRKTISDGRGLFLEVMPTGAASWRYRYQLRGKTEKVSIGPYPLVGLKEARIKRDEFAADAFRGESPAQQKQLQKVALATATTMSEFCERYYEEVIVKCRKDAKQMRRYLEKEICPLIWQQAASRGDGSGSTTPGLPKARTTASLRLQPRYVIC